MVFDAGIGQSLDALTTGTTLATVMLATLVAAPGLGIVYAQRLAVAGYVALGNPGIGSQHLYAGIGSQP